MSFKKWKNVCVYGYFLVLFKFDFTSQMMIYVCGNFIMYQALYHFDHGLRWVELQQGQVVDNTKGGENILVVYIGYIHWN